MFQAVWIGLLYFVEVALLDGLYAVLVDGEFEFVAGVSA